MAAAAPGLQVSSPPTAPPRCGCCREADAAFGTLDPELLAAARKLQWLQAPQAAPPAGYFFPELVAHPVQVTNFRGIYNDHVAIHAVAMLLALARNLHTYMRQQPRAEWIAAPGRQRHPAPAREHGAGDRRWRHRRRDRRAWSRAFGAHVIGVDPRRRIRAAGHDGDAPRPRRWIGCCRRPTP